MRISFNRDEQLSRPAGWPPALRRVSNREAVFPVDPLSGGTWLAATDAALVLAILNVNPVEWDARGKVSRGTIIPALLSASSPAEAVSLVHRKFDLPQFAPFRLVALDLEQAAELAWRGDSLETASHTLDGPPLIFTSSGLGDHRVAGPRIDLFRRMLDVSPADLPAAQDAFHRHFWPDRPEISVNMHREDARTVSYSVVELGPERIRFAYHPDAPDRMAEATTIEISRQLSEQ